MMHGLQYDEARNDSTLVEPYVDQGILVAFASGLLHLSSKNHKDVSKLIPLTIFLSTVLL